MPVWWQDGVSMPLRTPQKCCCSVSRIASTNLADIRRVCTISRSPCSATGKTWPEREGTSSATSWESSILRPQVGHSPHLSRSCLLPGHSLQVHHVSSIPPHSLLMLPECLFSVQTRPTSMRSIAPPTYCSILVSWPSTFTTTRPTVAITSVLSHQKLRKKCWKP